VLSYLYIEYLFNDQEIDFIYLYGPPKTYIQQTFKRLGWGDLPEKDSSEKNNIYTITLRLTDRAKKFLDEENINIPEIIGIGKGSKNIAEMNAYEEAFKLFLKVGFNHDKVINLKFSREFNLKNKPEYSQYYNKLYNRMNADNFIQIDFNIPKSVKTTTVKIIQLKGYKIGLQRPFLIGTEMIVNNFDKNYKAENDAKMRLIRKYSESVSEVEEEMNVQSEVENFIDLYTARTVINKIHTKNQYEFNNIIDRLLINIYNGNQGYDKARSECLEKKIDPKCIDDVKKILDRVEGSKLNQLKDKDTLTLYQILKDRYQNVGETDLVATVVRYAGITNIGTSSQQWALNYDLLDNIYNLGIDTEAFASPFNRYFDKYYSIFPEDQVFGSLGNFFNIIHSFDEKLYANPPFVEAILEQMVKVIKDIKVAVVITPSWTDANWYKDLKKYGFSSNLLADVKYREINLEGNRTDKEIIPRFKTTIWTKGVDIKDVMNPKKISNDVEQKMVKLVENGNSKYCYVFVVWGNPKYLVGALAGAYSLRKVKTQFDIVLMYGEMDLPDIVINTELFDDVIKIDIVKIKTIEPRTVRQKELYGGYFSETIINKWSCLNLVQYEKVCFVDSDIVFQHNPDDLFQLNTPAACFSNIYIDKYDSNGPISNVYGKLKHGDIVPYTKILSELNKTYTINASLVILTPKANEFNQILNWVNSVGKYGHLNTNSAIDEQIISEWYTKQKINWYHIDPIYEAIPWKIGKDGSKNWVPSIKGDISKAIGLHFFHDKPWEKGQAEDWEDNKYWWSFWWGLCEGDDGDGGGGGSGGESGRDYGELCDYANSLIDPEILKNAEKWR